MEPGTWRQLTSSVIAVTSVAGFLFFSRAQACADDSGGSNPAVEKAASKAKYPRVTEELLLRLRTGELLRGRGESLREQAITLQASFGETTLKLEQVTSITFDQKTEKFRVHLGNGSKLSGTIGSAAITIETTAGEKKSLEWNTIASLERIAPDRELLAALEEIDGVELVNTLQIDQTKFPEAKLVLAEAVKRDRTLRKLAEANRGRMPPHPPLLEDATKLELIRVFDPTREPMRRHAGQPAEVEGSYAPKALVGKSGGIMLWGPYVNLEKGRYLALYRMQYIQKPNGGNVSFFDVCHNANTWKGIRPNADEVGGPGQWNHVPVPFRTTETKAFEFRLWPHGREIAHDRIYLFKLE